MNETTTTAPAKSRWAVARGRYRFLEGLQRLVPFFWESLAADVWLTTESALPSWLAQKHVVDDWFIHIVRRTLTYWAAYPDSPAARLLPGHVWFDFTEPLDWESARFAPMIELAHPILVREPSLHWESREEFAGRMRRDFESQLKLYMQSDYLGDAFEEESRTRMRDVEWTVARFCKVPVRTIVDTWFEVGGPGLSERNEDPEQAVRTATGRFAREIDLTFPAQA